MNRLSVVIAMSVLGLSSSALAADEEHGRNRALSNLDQMTETAPSTIEEFQQRGAEKPGPPRQRWQRRPDCR